MRLYKEEFIELNRPRKYLSLSMVKASEQVVHVEY